MNIRELFLKGEIKESMSELRLLFTGVGRRIELLQAFRNAALHLNKSLKIYGADMAGTAPALCYCDFTRKVVAMKDPGYIDNLLDICKKDKIDLLIPTIDTDLLVLSRNKEKFEQIGTKVMISDPDKVLICRDKNNTSQFFVDCGLAAPMPVNDVRRYAGGFPAFIKPKDGSSSINAFKVENEEELIMYSQQVEDYIVQPFISGKEYTIDIFCDFDGKPISVIPRERMQVRAGEVLKTRIFMDETMIKEAKALCEKFKPCGPITVQLIQDEKSKVNYYIEINPRYGGGAPLSMKAGARSAEYILKLLSGEEVKEPETISDGAIYSRFDQSVCIEEGNGKISAVIFDLDDTLYPERDYVRSGYAAVAQYLGHPEYADKLFGYFEEGKNAFDELIAYMSENDPGEKPELSALLEVYREHEPQISLYPEMEKAIDSLKAKGIKIGIITDGRISGQKNKIKALGLDEKVDEIIITDELGGIQFRKPCDIAFRIMQTRWRLPFEEILYVGDNPAKDFVAPMQLGMKSLYFKNPEGLYSRDITSMLFESNDMKSIVEKLGAC